ncbi:beta-propeller fold lactonase family protein [Chromobacterium vaccinii]|uniref:YncE family protein n=1 Tax=Chromobacterium vaccinii TaxID=1108595 RepID=UPI001E432A00|nr:beta-propeller fold lactonase family protein [Chromobacterium vaccinii]MCD4486800.1 beta-propeller fold lactonase family protein [Chromobacterium vaccinii]
MRKTASLLAASALWALAQISAAAQAFDPDIHNNTLAVSPDESLAIAGNSQTAELKVYDLAQGRLKAALPGFITPRNIVFAPDGRRFYVTDSSKGLLERWNAGTLTLEASLALGPGAFGSAIDRQGARLYVNNQASNTVSVVDLNAWRVSKVITGFSGPRQGVKLSPDGAELYVTNFRSDKLSVVDTSSLSVLREIGGFNKIRAISISADGGTLYAANSGDDTLARVDTRSGKITATVAVGREPYGAALRPDGKVLYSGNLKSDSLTEVALPAFRPAAQIGGLSGPRQAISFSKDSRKAWVLNEDLSVAELDLATRRITRELKPSAN